MQYSNKCRCNKKMRIEYCGVCDKGAVREVNQDAIFMDVRKDMALFVVADGMGGHMHGEAASGIIVTELRQWWERCQAVSYRAGNPENFDRIVCSLREQITYANRVIYKQYNNGMNVCGSTIVVLLIWGSHYCILSCGDSRIYYLRGLRYEQMTMDDVWENQPDIIASYESRQIREHAYYGKLVRAVGVSKNVKLNEQINVLEDGGRFLLCSDGLYKMCREKDIKRILRRYKGNRNGDKLLKQMMRRVYADGARDNTSVILVRWWSGYRW